MNKKDPAEVIVAAIGVVVFTVIALCVVFAIKGFMVMIAWNYIIMNLIAGTSSMSFLQAFVLAALWSIIAFANQSSSSKKD